MDTKQALNFLFWLGMSLPIIRFSGPSRVAVNIGLLSLQGCYWLVHRKLLISQESEHAVSHLESTNFYWLGLPKCSGKESACQCRRPKRLRFDPWVRKIPWRRKWQPAPIFLPGESHVQRNLMGYSPWGRKRIRYDLAAEHAHTQFLLITYTYFTEDFHIFNFIWL